MTAMTNFILNVLDVLDVSKGKLSESLKDTSLQFVAVCYFGLISRKKKSDWRVAGIEMFYTAPLGSRRGFEFMSWNSEVVEGGLE